MDKLDSILATARSVKPPPNIPQPPIDPRLWEEAVGTRIANRAQPLRLERGILSVRVATSAWANELSLLADDILAQLTAAGVEASSLRFSVGRVRQTNRRRGKARKAAPPDAKLPEKLEAPIASIEDDDLKRAVGDAAAKSLSMKKR
jgi:predicted nucleic acid-binding Zn ribbon protein